MLLILHFFKNSTLTYLLERLLIDFLSTIMQDEGDYKGENFDELTLHLSDFQQKQIGTQAEDIIEKKLGATSPSLSKVVQQGFGDNFGYADNANKRDFLGADNFNYNAIFGNLCSTQWRKTCLRCLR